MPSADRLNSVVDHGSAGAEDLNTTLYDENSMILPYHMYHISLFLAHAHSLSVSRFYLISSKESLAKVGLVVEFCEPPSKRATTICITIYLYSHPWTCRGKRARGIHASIYRVNHIPCADYNSLQATDGFRNVLGQRGSTTAAWTRRTHAS